MDYLMLDICQVKIASHYRSQISLHAQQRAEENERNGFYGTMSMRDRVNKWRVGLSGEFAVAMVLGQPFEFREVEYGAGDGGIDLWQHGVSIDVKTRKFPSYPTIRIWNPYEINAASMAFVAQDQKDNFETFNILGWLPTSDVRQLSKDGGCVDLCPCKLHVLDSSFPDRNYRYRYLEENPGTCPRCKR